MTSTSRMFKALRGGKVTKRILTMLLGFTTAAFTGQALAQGGTWETKTPMPTPRGAMVGGEVNGVLYVAGGFDGISGVATNEAYDTVTDTWATKAAMPTPRYGLAGGVVNGILYAVGGQLGLTSLATVEAYDPTTDTWTSKAPLPTPRNRVAGGVVDGTLYIVGGCIDIACATFVSTVHAYDPSSDTWTPKASMPTPRRDFAVGVVDGILYAVGGAQGPGPSPFLTTVEAYDPGTDTWTTKAPLPVGRDGHAAVGLNGKLYVVGGVTPGQVFTDTIHVYDPASDTWTTAAPLPTLRCCPFTGAVQGVLYAIGGTDFTGVNEAFTPVSPVINVAIDIKPGSDPNSINPRSKGVIPVAILTTGTFDATTVDPSTVLFGKTGTEAAPVHFALEDVDGDGDTDMILHFNTQSTGIVCATTSASLTGETFSGQMIQGSDSVKTAGCK